MKKNNTNKNYRDLLNFFTFKSNSFWDNFKNFFSKEFKFYSFIRSILFIFIAAFLSVFAFTFLINRIGLYMVGTSGIVQLISKIIAKDPESRAKIFFIVYFCFNLPLFLFSFWKLDFRFTFYTFIYLLFQLLISNWFLPFLNLKEYIIEGQEINFFGVKYHYENNKGGEVFQLFFLTFLSSLFYGCSYGFLFRNNASSGGTDFFAFYISLRKHYSIARLVSIFNIIIAFIAVLITNFFINEKDSNIVNQIFKEPTLLATVCFIFGNSFVTDLVYPKFKMVTVFLISNEKDIALEKTKFYKKEKFTHYPRGASSWAVKGLYSGRDYFMIMTTMNLLEYSFFKNKLFFDKEKHNYLIVLSTKYFFSKY